MTKDEAIVKMKEKAADGTVYRKQDNCVYDAPALPGAWEEV